jgi:hypothetical protein
LYRLVVSRQRLDHAGLSVGYRLNGLPNSANHPRGPKRSESGAGKGCQQSNIVRAGVALDGESMKVERLS